ncbi:MAG: MFS transporter, partial [Firmicutes bacterium]|nr:MFS transporter [Bacillota bacterium]
MFIQEAVRPYRGLPKSVYFLFISKIVNSIGNFVMPFLAIFLTDRLGMREDQAGFFVMLAAIAFVPGSLIGGKLADIYGRKKVLILFHGLSGLCFVPCAFLGPSMLVTWLLVASSLFIGASNPAYTAMVTDLTDMGNRKQ